MSELITSYQASTIINNKLRELIQNGVAVDKFPLPPQMFYNYTTARIRENRKPAIQCVVDNGKTFVVRDDLERWWLQYAARKGYVLEVEDTEQLAFDLSEAQ